MKVPIWVIVLFLVVGLAIGWWAGGRRATVPVSEPAEHAGHEQHEGEEGHEEHGEEGHAEHEGEEGHEEHPEGEVELTPEQIKRAGIVIQSVALKPVQPAFQATGTLVADPNREVHVSAPVSGRILEVQVQEGQRVVAGQDLVVLDSPDLARARAEFQRAQVEVDLTERELGRRTSLARVGDETRRQVEEARVDVTTAESSLASARARQDVASRKLRRVQELLEDGIASTQQMEEARGTLREAEADVRRYESELKGARSHLKREEAILSQGLVANREVAEAQAASARAQADVRRSRDVVEAMGASASQAGASMTISAPLSGTVTARAISRGEAVDQGADLFTLLDTDTMWLWVAVPETQAAALREATSVQFTVAGKSFRGKIGYLDPELDPKTRNLRARVELTNSGRVLRPNMFVEVRVLGPSQGQGVSLPAPAIQTVEDKDVVYLAGESGHFVRTAVKIGQRTGDRVTVLAGLKPGDRVVTAGAFSIKSEDLRATMGEGHSH